MKRGNTAFSFFALLLSFSLSLTAEEFHIVGSRAMGMGGAGVAVTRGVLSTYWNPAGLQHYLDGLQYALGDLEADATPSSKINRKEVLAPAAP